MYNVLERLRGILVCQGSRTTNQIKNLESYSSTDYEKPASHRSDSFSELLGIYSNPP